ncbi:hypothetical protein NQ317_010536 [Molorchus minor]|uniref:Uncharacterized protein n=1 Tax=Molorchus minor TaxID=1323400 RepID=A0ABQ9JY54_9CUCU|nr:hypothetical protein NQ317_010536 [Molorchus minor]
MDFLFFEIIKIFHTESFNIPYGLGLLHSTGSVFFTINWFYLCIAQLRICCSDSIQRLNFNGVNTQLEEYCHSDEKQS